MRAWVGAFIASQTLLPGHLDELFQNPPLLVPLYGKILSALKRKDARSD